MAFNDLKEILEKERAKGTIILTNVYEIPDRFNGIIYIEGWKIAYYTIGSLHHVAEPAIITTTSKEWYRYDVRHRADNLPAVIWSDRDRDVVREEWHCYGQKHRGDGPAVVTIDGLQEWWYSNQLHREDGPAIIEENGYCHWYSCGIKHRLDGPAAYSMNNSVEPEYWIHGNKLHAEQIIQLIELWFNDVKKQNMPTNKLTPPTISHLLQTYHSAFMIPT